MGLPGIHGPTVIGIQGIGVKTPRAAAVAAATIGFAIELHTPNGSMFNNGLLSMMFAAGMGVNVRLMGRTIKDDGATPKVHLRVAPIQT